MTFEVPCGWSLVPFPLLRFKAIEPGDPMPIVKVGPKQRVEHRRDMVSWDMPSKYGEERKVLVWAD